MAVLVATRDRPDDLAHALGSVLAQRGVAFHVVVLDDAGAVPACEAPALRPFAADPRVTWLRNAAPAGVAGTRNRLFGAARAPVLVVLDDDAAFDAPDALVRIADAFDADPALGFVALRVRDVLPGGGERVQAHASQRALRRAPGLAERDAPAVLFQGMAHALHRRLLDAVGGYDPGGVYGHEELDLSLRALAAGFSGRYLASVRVTHRPRGGTAPVEVQRLRTRHLIRNRLLVAWRHLPLPYAAVHALVWLAHDALRAARAGHLRAWAQGVAEAVRGLPSTPRRPVPPAAVAALRRHGGRLWF